MDVPLYLNKSLWAKEMFGCLMTRPLSHNALAIDILGLDFYVFSNISKSFGKSQSPTWISKYCDVLVLKGPWRVWEKEY